MDGIGEWCGITEYIPRKTEFGRFPGRVKALWEDFHVREVSLDGHVVRLDELFSKKEIAEGLEEDKILEEGSEVLDGPFRLEDDARKELVEKFCFLERDVELLEHLCSLLSSVKAKCREAIREKANELKVEFPRRHQIVSFINEHSDLMAQLVRLSNTGSLTFENAPHCIVCGDFEKCRLQFHGEGTDAKTINKDLRTRIHDGIKMHFPFLQSAAVGVSVVYEQQVAKASASSVVLEEQQLEDETLSSICEEDELNFQKASIGDEVKDLLSLRRIYFPGQLTRKKSPMFEKNEIVSILAILKSSGSSNNNNNSEDIVKLVVVRPKQICFESVFPHIVRTPRNNNHNTTHHHDNEMTRMAHFEPKWPSDRPGYLHFHVFKSNRTTVEVVNKIAKAVGIPAKKIGFSGTKDKKGVTVQQMSLPKVTKNRLLRSTLYNSWDNSIKLAHLVYKPKSLRLGDLKGNHFVVAIRQVSTENTPDVHNRINQTCNAFKNDGFINYFGPQRFGTSKIPTYEPGLAMLQGDWRKAVRLILGDQTMLSQPPAVKQEDEQQEDPAEPPNPKKQKTEGKSGVDRYLEDGDITAALKGLDSKIHFTEHTILSHLVDQPNDFLGAVCKLHNKQVAMYLHALQSYIWNVTVSRRIKQFGLQIFEGDIVKAANESPIIASDSTTSELDDDDANSVMTSLIDEADDIDTGSHVSQAFSVLISQADVASASIENVVMPLPGYSAVLSEKWNDLLESVCNDLMNITLQDFVNFNGTKFGLPTLPGGYRNIIIKPEHVEWEIITTNSDAMKPILASDLDILLRRDISVQDTFTSQLKLLSNFPLKPMDVGSENVKPHHQPQKSEEGDQAPAGDPSLTLLLSCCLPKGVYLTVAMRELLDQQSCINLVNDSKVRPPRNSFPRDRERGGYQQHGRPQKQNNSHNNGKRNNYNSSKKKGAKQLNLNF